MLSEIIIYFNFKFYVRYKKLIKKSSTAVHDSSERQRAEYVKTIKD